VPLVPGALLVLVDDAAGDSEGVAFESAGGADLDGRAVERQIGDLAYLAEIDVVPDEN
jgi:hypothetical protein